MKSKSIKQTKSNSSGVKNTKKGSIVKTNAPIDEIVQFKLDNINFNSIKTSSGFTNYFSDIYEAHNCFVLLFDKFLKHMRNRKIGNFNKNDHYHQITKEAEKICKDVIKKIRKSGDTIEDLEFYQFGIEGLRIITQKIGNVYEILFLDPYHLIYPDKNYNQKDYNNYTCCMVNLNEKTNNVKKELKRLKKENQELKDEIKIYKELFNEKTS